MLRKRIILLGMVAMLSIFGVLAAVVGVQMKEKPRINQGKEGGQTSSNILADKEDTIFFAENYEYIAMFGNPQFWDDEKNMALDVNRDGSDETFAIATSRKEGVLLEGSAKRYGSWDSMNFWSDRVFSLIQKATAQEKGQNRIVKAGDFLTRDLDELLWLLRDGCYVVKGSSILEDDYVQISSCDIDEDGTQEILVSAGNKKNHNVTAVYEYSQNGGKPFVFHGVIISNTAVEYRGSGVFWAYLAGSDKARHDEYRYENGKLRKIS